MLQTIVDTIEKQHWMRACANKKINKWELIDFVNEPVLISVRMPVPSEIRNCRLCGTEFNVKVIDGKFYLKQHCKCGRDGTTNLTLEKLRVFLPDSDAARSFAETNRKKRSGLANTLEYWIDRGYDKATAAAKAREVQILRSAKSPSSKPGARGYSIRTKEYWMNKGYSESDAIKQVSDIQVANGLPYYVKKYGEVLGPEKFAARIEQWLNAPGNKNMIKGRSTKSITLFELLPGNGHFGNNEKTVRGKTKVHRVDFLLGKKVIEYNGDYWHANPLLYPDGDQLIRKKKAKDIWIHDAAKVSDLEQAGYKVLVIWEAEYSSDHDAVINKCKEFLNED